MLDVQQISKKFGDKTVACGVSFQALSGSITALLGASGSGKSTLLNIIAGLMPADDGHVSLHGKVLDKVLPEKRRIAMMFQDFALLPHLNVWQNVAFGLQMQGIAKAQARQLAEQILQEVGLAGMAERRVANLSGGEQQRTALARALVVEPELLLLDEPFSGIDTALRGQLQQLVKHAVAQRNMPALMVTHDPAEACLMAQHIVLLGNGEVLQQGAPERLLCQPISAQAARLMGCLNVCDEHYIPQQAIELNQIDGLNCQVLDVFRQPLFWRITLLHPKYGELVYLCENADFAVHDAVCKISLNEAAIVRFA